MEYPDLEEEFEQQYADELDELTQMEFADERDGLVRPKSKRSLDFSSIPQPGPSQESAGFGSGGVKPLDFNQGSLSGGKDGKSTAEDLFGDIDDIEEEDALYIAEEQERLISPKSRRSLDFAASNQPGPSQESIGLGGGVKPLDYRQKSSSGGRDAKRPVDDLFTDATDYQIIAKRKKYSEMTQDERDDDLIAKILYYRNEAKKAKVDPNPEEGEEKRKGKISRKILPGPFVTIMTGENIKLYLELLSEEEFDAEVRKTVAKKKNVGLLTEPFSALRDKALETLQKQEEKAALEAKQPEVAMDVDSGHASDSKELWVEKYKPRRYMELLSDESANRTLLRWLKLWDTVVFNREPPIPKKRKYVVNIVDEKLDANKCPKQKVALLHGSPGSGKTTMAHFLARHAGYNPVEMNASDDRSPEAFRNQLEAATQMKAVMGESPRPNCLILDEIDGAPVASIEVLVKFVMGQDSGGKAKKGKKKKATILKRPIICICNELYVAALRPLRQIALVIQLSEISTSRLAQRLCHITKQEGVKADEYALMTLAEKANNDIRSCLSTLQFLKEGKKEITLADIKLNIGQKDIHKGLFEVWQEIFQITRPKWYTVKPENLKYASKNMPITKLPHRVRAMNTLFSVKSCGDNERLVQGVFENYPKMIFSDKRMKVVVDSLEWFCDVDIKNHHMKTTQDYTSLAYIPYAFVKWHFNFGSIYRPKLKYPTADYEAFVKKSRGKQVLKQLVSGMSPAAKSYNNECTLILETLPLLLHIISPDLPPINELLYTKRQKEEMENVINIMLYWHLRYTQERTAKGDYDYVLDPNLEIVVRFPHTSSDAGCPTLSYVLKQIIARKIHHALIMMNESVPTNPATTQDVAPESPKKSTAKPKLSKKVKGKAKADESIPRLTEYFKTEHKELPRLECQLQKASKKPSRPKAWFHFNEGFSNALRKSVKMAALWEV